MRFRDTFPIILAAIAGGMLVALPASAGFEGGAVSISRGGTGVTTGLTGVPQLNASANAFVSSGTGPVLSVTSTAAAVVTTAQFQVTDTSGHNYVQLGRKQANRGNLIEYTTNGLVDWCEGTVYNAGTNNSEWSIGTDQNLSNSRLHITTSGNVGIAMGATAADEKLTIAGNLKLNTVGNKELIKEGSNASMGRATLTSGAVTVSNTLVTASSEIFLTTQSPSGTVGTPYVSARVAGSSFTITSTSGADASTVAWHIIEPAP